MLSAGTRVGPFEIVSWLGAGGMGEVYRARDTKLGREVALKTLPEELAHQSERLARLRQEARILASLNHPGIATLHGLEESGNGVPVLVMELVEGESLADRLRRGPLPLREALIVAQQIALALEAAHEKGILHRDLKPGNVRLGLDGRVKLLDFGLAKVVREAAIDSQTATKTSPSDPAAVVGTAPYMSPEQARGKELDRRTDVWAFGCVLFEMLSGKRAFDGATFSDAVAAVLDREPEWQAVPTGTPPAVLKLLRRCLQKEKDKRLHDVADARLELEELLVGTASAAGGGEDAPAVTALRPRRLWHGLIGSRLLWLVVGTAVGRAGLWAIGTPHPLMKRPVVRLAIPLSPEETVWAIAMSPDGTHLAYMASRGHRSQIYLRTLDQLEARPIPGTEEATAPFFSPDGRWLGFTSLRQAGDDLRKVLLAGGAPVILSKVSSGTGASWGPDGMIVFTSDTTSGLLRVSSDGGAPRALTRLDASRHDGSHRFPEVLPGGEAVVFTVKPDDVLSWDDARIEAASLRTGERSILITGGTQPRYVAGFLVYHRQGSLWAVPFDPMRLKVTGPPLLVLEGVSSSAAYGRVAYGVSEDGSLAYLPGRPRGTDRTLVRVDRAGRRKPLTNLRRAFGTLRLSPDGRRLGVHVQGPNTQVWVYDLERGALTPQTLRWDNESPIWTPDGRRLTFSSNREGTTWNLFWQPADGSGPAERLAKSANQQTASSWSPDGKILFFTDGPDICTLEPDRDQRPRPFLHGRYATGVARVSPNGRWVAFVSDESSRPEVYVRPFPGPGSRWTVSTEGGLEPVWARNGRELFYRNGDRIMAVTVTSEATWSASRPRVLFEAKAPLRDVDESFDVTPEGDFLMIEPGESDAPPAQINVVLNWAQEIRQRLATR